MNVTTGAVAAHLPPGSTAKAKSWPVVLGLIAIMALAVALRMPGLDRPPQLKFLSLYQDEYKIYANTLRVMKGSSLLAHWPYGIYRILVPQFQVLRAVHTARYTEHLFPLLPMKEFIGTTTYEIQNVFLLLRLNALAFGLGIIALTFAIGRKIGGVSGGNLAAFLVAITPVMVNYSRMMYYDIAMVFFFIAYIYLFSRSWESKSLKYVYATVAVSAIAFVMKQTAGILFLLNVILVLDVIAAWRIGAAFRSRHTYFLVLLCIVIIALGYPTLFRREGVSTLFTVVELSHLGGHPNHLWKAWLNEIWHQQAPLGVFLFLTVGTVIGAFLAENKNFGWPVLLTGLLYYAIVGYSVHTRDRMLLPLIPLLCLGIAGWGAWFRSWKKSGFARLALACAMIFTAVPLLANTMRYNILVSLPDTRIQALNWLTNNAPGGAKIALEAYAPHLPLPLPEGLKDTSNRKTFDARQYSTLVTLEPKDYIAGDYQYLVHAAWNYKRVEAKWNTENLDAGRLQRGKSPHWGFGRKEVLRRYDQIAEAFPVAARFTPIYPPASLVKRGKATGLLDLLFSNWWDSNLITFWEERKQYVLGSEIVIYQVVPLKE